MSKLFYDKYIRNKKIISHSAKGSEWDEHKYIKRIDGTYYYPDNYEGGRHLSDNTKKDNSSSSEKVELTENDIEKLANEVIKGNFGNGKTRKELLGTDYQKVQDRVNKILKSSIGSQKVSDSSSSKKIESGEKTMNKAIEKVTVASKGLNLDQVYSVYRNKK